MKQEKSKRCNIRDEELDAFFDEHGNDNSERPEVIEEECEWCGGKRNWLSITKIIKESSGGSYGIGYGTKCLRKLNIPILNPKTGKDHSTEVKREVANGPWSFPFEDEEYTDSS